MGYCKKAFGNTEQENSTERVRKAVSCGFAIEKQFALLKTTFWNSRIKDHVCADRSPGANEHKTPTILRNRTYKFGSCERLWLNNVRDAPEKTGQFVGEDGNSSPVIADRDAG